MEGAVNRPGLALAGFYKSFAFHRVQVIGSSETQYLKSLPETESRARLRELVKRRIPCLIFARNINPPKLVLEMAEEENIAVFKSPLTTMRLINTTTICLELDFAPTTSEHGSMVDILGIGVMVRGASGIGKSECVLSLVERGHSLVADDVTRIRSLEGRELIGTSSDLSRFHMEVRGLGIINIASIYGVRSIRFEKRLDMVGHPAGLARGAGDRPHRPRAGLLRNPANPHPACDHSSAARAESGQFGRGGRP